MASSLATTRKTTALASIVVKIAASNARFPTLRCVDAVATDGGYHPGFSIRSAWEKSGRKERWGSPEQLSWASRIALGDSSGAEDRNISVIADRIGYATGRPPDGETMWKEATRLAEKRSESLQKPVAVTVRDPLPIALGFISDQHIGSTGTNYVEMERNANTVKQCDGMFAVFGGDTIDNHIAIATAILHAKHTPDEQFAMMEHYLNMFDGKILGMISGNHDLWTDKKAGIDLVRREANRRHILYARHELRLVVDHHGVSYRISVRHRARGFGSRMNPVHAVKQGNRFGDWLHDVGVLCHEHEAGLEQYWMHGLPCWGARPGSYLVNDDYANEYGYNKADPTCPTFVLFPEERRIVGFSHIEHAATFLKAARSEAAQRR